MKSRGSEARVERLERTCEAYTQLDRFFDVVHEIDATRSVYDASALRTMMRRFLESGARLVRRPWSDCVYALALFHLGERSAAAEALDEAGAIRRTRAVVALSALVTGDDPADALVTEPVAADPAGVEPVDLADDHVLVAAALRLDGASEGAIRVEIGRAMEWRRDHYRAREALALLELREGQHAKALGLFLGLVTGEGYRPVTLLHQAYEALLLGDLELADRCLRQVPEADRDAKHALTSFQLLRRRGHAEEALALAREAVETWPNAGEVRFALGQAELDAGLVERAVGSFRVALELGPRPFVKERVSSLLAACELQQLLTNTPRDLDLGTALQDRAGRWAQQAAEMTDRIAASDLHLIVARTRRLLGQIDRAWDALDRAIQVDADNHAASATLALWAAERAINDRLEGTEPSSDRQETLRRAQQYVDTITSGAIPAGERTLPDQCRQDAWYAAFLLAWCRDDPAAIDDAYRRLPTAAPYYWDTQREAIESLVGG